MVFKGFINYKDSKLPFVIENNILEIFGEDILVNQFTSEYNFKQNYILEGYCISDNVIKRKLIAYVKESLGSRCILKCFIVAIHNLPLHYDKIHFQSQVADNVFQYKYNFLAKTKEGVNLSAEECLIYNIPFIKNNKDYMLEYKIGHKPGFGILEDFNKKGELSVAVEKQSIMELYELTILMERFIKFTASYKEVLFKKVYVSNKGLVSAHLYLPLIGDSPYDEDILFQNFQIDFYGTKILNNLAIDLNTNITNSIPLGHIKTFDSWFTPQRFIEQITSFEYLFEKLEHDKAIDKKFPLAKELEFMFNQFPEILWPSKNSLEFANNIKELRRQISHGYTYYYDFNNDRSIKAYMLKLDGLIENMSLRLVGFDNNEILKFRVPTFQH